MVRRLVSLLLLVACLTVCVEDALAKDGLWGWLEQFSGPGPFRGPSVELFKACKDPRTGSLGPKIFGTWRAGTPSESVPCLWGDQRFFRARADGGFPEAQAFLFDQGVSFSFKRAVSAGVGAGLIRFVSAAPGGDVKTTRFTVTPIRLTVTPAGIFEAALKKKLNPGLSKVLLVPQAYGKFVCVAGRLSGKDFGVPANPYQSGAHGECVKSWGIQFNLLELLGD